MKTCEEQILKKIHGVKYATHGFLHQHDKVPHLCFPFCHSSGPPGGRERPQQARNSSWVWWGQGSRSHLRRIRFEKAELDLQTWESMPILQQFGMVRVYTTCRRISQTRELKSRVYRWCLTLPFTGGWSPSFESCARLPYTLCVRVLRPS